VARGILALFRLELVALGFIADRGYELVSCQQIGGLSPDDWCGNILRFPGYPWLIRTLEWLFGGFGISGELAGEILSAAFFFLGLMILWFLLLDRGQAPRSGTILTMAAFFPGMIYDHAVFPISFLSTLCVLAIWLAIECHHEWMRQLFAQQLRTRPDLFSVAPSQ
jgi:hypothetical protein